MQAFISQKACSAAFTPSTLGYISNYDDNEFVIQLYVDSFVTAMAVNLGILSLEDLLIAQQVSLFTVIYSNSYFCMYVCMYVCMHCLYGCSVCILLMMYMYVRMYV